MTRYEFINHLYDQDCYPDEEGETEYNQLWHNAINGYVCNVPKEEYFKVRTWTHIVYELKIDPPHKYDADYHVYLGWREGPYKDEMMKQKKEG